MTDQLVHYSEEGGIAIIKLADGGSNLLSPSMITAVNEALDRAQSSADAVILTGAGEIFSAGFDLKVMKSGPIPTFKMLMGGFATVTRLVKLPMPLVVASNGHTVAAGVFLLLAGDYRIIREGDYKVVLNEVEIGMTMPFTALSIAKYRLTPTAFEQVINQSVVYSPNAAMEAGFLDEVVPAESVQERAKIKARSLAELNAKAFKNTKLRARRNLIRSIRWAVVKDFIDLIRQGVGQAIKKV